MAEREGRFIADLAKIEGLTFSDCIGYFAAEAGDPWVEAARKQHMDGELEIDSEAVRGGLVAADGEAREGDYVMGWIWVPGEEAEEIAGDDWQVWLNKKLNG